MAGKLYHTLNGNTQEKPPVWLMRQAGRYLPEYLKTRGEAGSFLDLCYTPSFATEVTLQPIRRFGFDAAILFSDILVVPHALGQDLKFAQNHGPQLGPLPDLENPDIEKFHVNLSAVYQAVTSIRAQLDNEGFSGTDLIGFSGAPWTLACYMIDGKGTKDFHETRVFALSNPKKFQSLIDLLTRLVSEYLVNQISRGANVVQIFDSWAGVLPPDQFRKWVIEPTKKIVTHIKHHKPTTPVIGFPKGAAFLYEEYAEKTAVDGIGIDTQVPPEYAARNLQKHCTVQGNLDPMTLRAGGPELEAQTEKILETLGKGRHIFNLGHGIDKDTPPSHVDQLLKIIRG
ncbi:MAG: uroporphyrinogen decarboxylase [Pseudobdellovibrionaceae bacterium]|jgi:uroporphyrinogen decarboxylase|nr:uroporphyrinogen decarboxylase [Pseudobdellovibrionaceae bacterium]